MPPSPRGNWTYTGCYTDDVAKRALYLNSYLATPMTNTLCVAFCEASGFLYAGTEYVKRSKSPKLVIHKLSLKLGVAMSASAATL